MNTSTRHLSVARTIMRAATVGIDNAFNSLDASFDQAVETLLALPGKAILTGTGKSGHIARKIAATLASTGCPAFFLHPADAGHGDLGMVATTDAIVALSRSGTSPELDRIVTHSRWLGIKFIILTCVADSPLAQAADITIAIDVPTEAGPLKMAPTTSTTAMLAVGDALAIALQTARSLTLEDFARTHPDGALGRKLLLRIADIMVTDTAVPSVIPSATVATAIVEMTAKCLGITTVLDDTGMLLGIFTNSDLRRCLESGADIHNMPVTEVMNSAPVTIAPEQLAHEAQELLKQHQLDHLPVLTGRQLVGVIDSHCLRQNKMA